MGREDYNNSKVKIYFNTLRLALLGRNPYRKELDELRNGYEKISSKIISLKDMYCSCVDNIDQYKKRTNGLNQLVENLRERIGEKDVILQRTKLEYQERLSTYNAEIDSLRNQLLQESARK